MVKKETTAQKVQGVNTNKLSFNGVPVVFKKIKRIMSWMPILWKACDCCDDSLFVIMRHQIKRMADEHADRNLYIGTEKNVKKMKVAVSLLSRIIDDNYYEIALMGHNLRWGEPTIWFDDDGCLNISRPNVLNEKQEEEEFRELQFAMKRVDYLEKQVVSQFGGL